MEVFSKNIAQLRKKSGLTQQQLGDKLGVSCQTVSKWECGVTLPDLSLVPALCRCFDISADQLLGIAPLPEGFIPAATGQKQYWEQRLDFLHRTRKYLWNDDYLAFLVQQVWQLNAPVRLLDCGCGFGALGLALLPLLPAGSSYTGVDHAPALLAEGRRLFAQQGLTAEFIEADIYEWQPLQQYDVVLCQSVLRHVGDAPALVRRMADFARTGGLVVCIEVDRTIEAAGLYIHGLDRAEVHAACDLTPLWCTEYRNKNRDWAMGVRLPHLLHEAGLRDIDARMNDRVTCLLPGTPQHDAVLADFLQSHDWGQELGGSDLEARLHYLTAHGLSRAAAEEHCRRLNDVARHLKKAGPEAAFTHLHGLFTVWGRK
ncbi:MAG: methyltransferase domain-containing protein [Oscillospiraceae bacterium]|nr:methyltransferase domain-containing protein [Oscillospiraceae bacterium]